MFPTSTQAIGPSWRGRAWLGVTLVFIYLTTLCILGCVFSWPVWLSPAGLRRSFHSSVPGNSQDRRICSGDQDQAISRNLTLGIAPTASCRYGRRASFRREGLAFSGYVAPGKWTWDPRKYLEGTPPDFRQ